MNQYETWLASMHTIYQKFESQMELATKNGMLPDPFVIDRKGGYFIFRRPDPRVATHVAKIGQMINTIAPSVAMYREISLHHTYTDYKVMSHCVPSTSADHKQTLEMFDELVRKVVKRAKNPVSTYDRVLFGLNAFILTGKTDQSLYDDACFIQEEAKKIDVDLRLPWGTHVTFGRTIDVLTKEQGVLLKDLCTRNDLSLIGEFPFVSVEAGWYTIDVEHGFVPHITSAVNY